MPKAPKSLSSPSLHDQWTKAKKAAQKAADKAAFKALKKAFKADLGPNLDKWPKLYPDYPKMEKLHADKIQPAIKAYIKAIGNSTVAEPVQDDLNFALVKIRSAMDERNKEAERVIASDETHGFAESNKKSNPPIIVLQYRNLLTELKLDGKNIGCDGSMPIEILIDDDEILKKYPPGKDYSNKAAKIVAAANTDQLKKDIRSAFDDADKSVAKGTSLSSASSKFESEVDQAIEEARKRATDEAGRLGKLSGKVKWAKVKRGGRLTLAFAGAMASIAGLAATPFTAGASTIAGIIGLAKLAVQIGHDIADIASTAEMMANGICKDLNKLYKQYGKWLVESKREGKTSNKIGGAELGKRAVNALLPTYVTNLKTVKGDVGTYEEKIDNLEAGADKLGDTLDDWLDKQSEADKQYKGIQKLGRDALTDAEAKKLQKILAGLAKTESKVRDLITDITKLNARVKKNQTIHRKLAAQVNGISMSNPVWSEVGSTLFEASSGVAFLLAGNVNAPDAYKCAEIVAKVAQVVSATASSLAELDNLANELADSYSARKKKVKT